MKIRHHTHPVWLRELLRHPLKPAGPWAKAHGSDCVLPQAGAPGLLLNLTEHFIENECSCHGSIETFHLRLHGDVQVVVGKLENSSVQALTFIANHDRQRRVEGGFKEGLAIPRSGNPDAISAALELASFDPLQKRNREKRGGGSTDDLGVETGDGVGTGGNTEDSRGSGSPQQRAQIARILEFVQVENP